jgi:hypothetical protein
MYDLQRFFKRVQDTMPRGRVTSVSDQEKVDAIAYILQVNGFPPGAAALPQNAAALGRITFPGGTGPLPIGMLVRTIGRFQPDEGLGAEPRDAIEPATLDPPRPTAQHGALPLNELVSLNVFRARRSCHAQDGGEGHAAANPAGPGINVVPMTMLSATCP